MAPQKETSDGQLPKPGQQSRAGAAAKPGNGRQLWSEKWPSTLPAEGTRRSGGDIDEISLGFYLAVGYVSLARMGSVERPPTGHLTQLGAHWPTVPCGLASTNVAVLACKGTPAPPDEAIPWRILAIFGI